MPIRSVAASTPPWPTATRCWRPPAARKRSGSTTWTDPGSPGADPLPLKPAADRAGHVLDLVERQLGVHRERQHASREPVGVREARRAVAELSQRGLAVKRNRIVDAGGDPLRGQP